MLLPAHREYLAGQRPAVQRRLLLLPSQRDLAADVDETAERYSAAAGGMLETGQSRNA